MKNEEKKDRKQSPSVGTTQRQPPLKRPKRERPRRLIVNEQSNHISGPLFELDPLQFFWDVMQRPVDRPLPAVTTVLAVAPQHRQNNTNRATTKPSSQEKEIPLLQKYQHESTKSDGKVSPTDDTKTINEMDEVQKTIGKGGKINKTTKSPLDQNSIILTKGHHKRLQELSLMMKTGNSMNVNRKKELKKLRELLQEERRLYSVALNQFREQNYERFLLGFKVQGPASQFVQTYSEYIKQYRERFINTRQPKAVTKYSKCTQYISLQNSMGNRKESRIDMETFHPQIFFPDNDEQHLRRALPSWADDCLKSPRLVSKQQNTQNLPIPLCEDEQAKLLAIEHSVDIITTDSALKTLLLCSSTDFPESQFVIPLSSICDTNDTSMKQSASSLIVMEDPVPRATNPRECLSIGMEESLYDMLPSTDEDSSTAIQNVYSLLTFPKSMTQDCKVLVRSSNRIQDENGCPLKLFAHLEYFSERGLEEYYSCDKCLWLLQKILQPKCRICVVRIDPNISSILKIEEKDTADTLSGNATVQGSFGPITEESNNNKDVNYRFEVMMNIIRGIKTIDSGTDSRRFVMCLPGRGVRLSPETTTSIHNAILHQDDQTSSTSVLVDLEQEFCEGESVFMSKNALMQCFRIWEWKNDQLPFTFRIKDEVNHQDDNINSDDSEGNSLSF